MNVPLGTVFANPVTYIAGAAPLLLRPVTINYYQAIELALNRINNWFTQRITATITFCIRAVRSNSKPVRPRDMFSGCSCKLNVRVPCYSESQGQVWSKDQDI